MGRFDRRRVSARIGFLFGFISGFVSAKNPRPTGTSSGRQTFIFEVEGG
jgi:hypothetical protein